MISATVIEFPTSHPVVKEALIALTAPLSSLIASSNCAFSIAFVPRIEKHTLSVFAESSRTQFVHWSI